MRGVQCSLEMLQYIAERTKREEGLPQIHLGLGVGTLSMVCILYGDGGGDGADRGGR